MELRTLGKTGLQLPALSFGASSLGQEFRPVDLQEALQSVHVALELGMNFIDTSPFYGRGMSEVLLGIALRDVPRDRYLLGTKLGRYDRDHFDFSARRVVDRSRHVWVQDTSPFAARRRAARSARLDARIEGSPPGAGARSATTQVGRNRISNARTEHRERRVGSLPCRAAARQCRQPRRERNHRIVPGHGQRKSGIG